MVVVFVGAAMIVVTKGTGMGVMMDVFMEEKEEVVR